MFAECDAMAARIRYLLLIPIMVLSLWPPVPAHADAIDGKWCFSDGRLFSIAGPQIITPAGTRTQGEYDRHAFAYNVPDGEAHAGATIFMIMVDEDTIYVSDGAWPGRTDQNGVQIWTRCTAETS